MTAQRLTVQVRHRPRVAIIDVHGQIDAYAEEHVDGDDHTLELVMFLEEPTDTANQTPADPGPEEGADHDDQ